MALRSKYVVWLALSSVLALALIALACVVFWADLHAQERQALADMLGSRALLLVILALLPSLVIGGLLQLLLAAYPQAAVKLAEEVRLIYSVHPAHRVALTGAAEMRQLGSAVNELAEAHRALSQEVQARIDEASAHLAQEKNRLAALMSELAQSVLVCNSEGRILLYNAQASRLLVQSDGAEVPVGLGRSVFGILDRSPIIHALGQLVHRLEQGVPQPVARFVTARGGRLLRAQMAPVLDQQGAVTGFVLMLEDITRTVEDTSRRDQLLQQLTEGSRASLANLRAAAETMQQYPEMDAARRERFFDVIADEASRLSRQLEEVLAAQGDAPGTSWMMEDMLAGDLLFALRGNLPAGPRIAADAQAESAPLWLSVNSYAMVQALSHLAGRLATAFGLDEVGLELGTVGRWIRLTLHWRGKTLDPAVLHDWEGQPLSIGAVAGAASLKQVLEQHGAEMWCQADPAGARQLLCLQLPAAQPEHIAAVPQALGGRPVYYDFDLFSQPGQSPQLDDRPLNELAYTVFDTETTGLAPSEGDEIISIGAVRILNGRLLEQEFFDRLVQPRTAIRRESQAVHGITSSMLAAQPFIEQVLPAFQRFAEDTVLVAHNAAFDMRLLQLAQARTGVAFVQPVLDTLLLSALVHPGHADDHRLEQIAERLGVQVIGRHTALGDAIVTGEVFLKLIPLLAERGIRTLKQAREASKRTRYAKLEY
jgi:DNA polymerase III subunit epsilon